MIILREKLDFHILKYYLKYGNLNKNQKHIQGERNLNKSILA